VFLHKIYMSIDQLGSIDRHVYWSTWFWLLMYVPIGFRKPFISKSEVSNIGSSLLYKCATDLKTNCYTSVPLTWKKIK
jgi:hypothetical protein